MRKIQQVIRVGAVLAVSFCAEHVVAQCSSSWTSIAHPTTCHSYSIPTISYDQFYGGCSANVSTYQAVVTRNRNVAPLPKPGYYQSSTYQSSTATVAKPPVIGNSRRVPATAPVHPAPQPVNYSSYWNYPQPVCSGGNCPFR